MQIGRFTAHVKYDDVAALTPGMDVVVCVADSDARHLVAREGYGIFEVREGVVVPLVRRPAGFRSARRFDVPALLSTSSPGGPARHGTSASGANVARDAAGRARSSP